MYEYIFFVLNKYTQYNFLLKQRYQGFIRKKSNDYTFSEFLISKKIICFVKDWYRYC